jgi:transcriptional regulator with XRE-family HTH domain
VSSRFASVAKPGAALRAFRRKQGWTLAEVNQKTGLPVSTLSRIETDQISPTYDQLSKLSVGLCIDMAQLLSGDMDDAKPVQTARRS